MYSLILNSHRLICFIEWKNALRASRCPGGWVAACARGEWKLYRTTLKALSHDETLHATLHATTELIRVTGFADVACNVSCNVPKVEIDPISATLHASLQIAVTLIATFARSVACNRFIVWQRLNTSCYKSNIVSIDFVAAGYSLTQIYWSNLEPHSFALARLGFIL